MYRLSCHLRSFILSQSLLCFSSIIFFIFSIAFSFSFSQLLFIFQVHISTKKRLWLLSLQLFIASSRGDLFLWFITTHSVIPPHSPISSIFPLLPADSYPSSSFPQLRLSTLKHRLFFYVLWSFPAFSLVAIFLVPSLLLLWLSRTTIAQLLQWLY